MDGELAAVGREKLSAAFDLRATIGSGQAFHWREVDGAFWGTVGDLPVRIWQDEAGRVSIDAAEVAAVERYFGLDHAMEQIWATFPAGDAVLERAQRFSPGLRLLRQPPWECLATFITSSMKKVSHIAAMSHALRLRFGAGQRLGGLEMFAYPTPEVLAGAGEEALRQLGLGYRAPFLARTAEMVASGDLDLAVPADPALTDAEALAYLCRAPGVGPKVASCVLLFAYGRWSAFPVDVWIQRILHRLYFPRRKKPPTLPELDRFSLEHFGPHRGYAQQYLFHYARLTRLLDEAPERGAPDRRITAVAPGRRRGPTNPASSGKAATPQNPVA